MGGDEGNGKLKVLIFGEKNKQHNRELLSKDHKAGGTGLAATGTSQKGKCLKWFNVLNDIKANVAKIPKYHYDNKSKCKPLQ